MLGRFLLSTSLVAVATFSGLCLSSFVTNAARPDAVLESALTHDEILADRVETLLRTDAGLVGSRFRVSVKSAVVTVAGSVPDVYSVQRALDLVSGVRGIREVRNALEIEELPG